MTARSAAQPLFAEPSPLQQDVLRTILYFDVFHYPLSPREIYEYLPSNSTSPAEVHKACVNVPLTFLLREDAGLYYLPQVSGERDPVLDRRENEQRAKRFMRIARVMGWIIRQFPFVRGVGVSGELSKGVVSPDGDIDFIVVTARRRVWVTRTLLILFKKVFLFNRKKYFCVNHFIAEDYFAVPEKNRYIALEIATLAPLFNASFFRRFVDHNSWIRTYFPNIQSVHTEDALDVPQGIFQKILELPLRRAFGDRLDEYLMGRWRSIWRRRYRHLSDDKLRELFRTEESISTAYAGDFLSQILQEYSKRLAAFGLEEVIGKAP
ncbi:MAG: hypothetical protein WEB33_09305 [Bacteroidota bacterium]